MTASSTATVLFLIQPTGQWDFRLYNVNEANERQECDEEKADAIKNGLQVLELMVTSPEFQGESKVWDLFDLLEGMRQVGPNS